MKHKAILAIQQFMAQLQSEIDRDIEPSLLFKGLLDFANVYFAPFMGDNNGNGGNTLI